MSWIFAKGAYETVKQHLTIVYSIGFDDLFHLNQKQTPP